MKGISIGRQKALELETLVPWSQMSSGNVAKFQCMVDELCMTMSQFQSAVNHLLKDDIPQMMYSSDHRIGLVRMIWGQDRTPPSYEEVMSLLPRTIRIMVQL